MGEEGSGTEPWRARQGKFLLGARGRGPSPRPTRSRTAGKRREAGSGR